MKRQIAFATALAASIVAGAAAQTPTPATPGAATGAGQMVTVTGCVTAPGSSAGAAATAAPSFILSNPTMGNAGAPGTPSPGAPGMTGSGGSTGTPSTSVTTTPPPSSTTPPASTTTPPSAAPSSTTSTAPGSPMSPQAGMPAGTSGMSNTAGYLLIGQADTLRGLQNQRVEVRGTFQNSASGGATTGAAMRTLRITSIQPVPGDCGPKQ